MNEYKPRYTLPTARAARVALAGEIRRHCCPDMARRYSAGLVSEKAIMSKAACQSIALDASGDKAGAKIARGVALLAAFLHEGKHQRPASADALRAFWAHYERVHGKP